MADTKISALTALTGANSASTDLFVLVDVSDTSMAATGTDKNMTRAELAEAIGLETITQLTAEAQILASGGVTTDATTTRTLAAGDNGKVLYFTSGSAITLTCASGLGAGFSCVIIQGGAGQITVAAGGQTLVAYGAQYKTVGQYAIAQILCPVANTFYLAGNTAA